MNSANKNLATGITALIFIGLGMLTYKLISLLTPTPIPSTTPAPPTIEERVIEDVFTAIRGVKVQPIGETSAIVYIGGKKYAYMKDLHTGGEIFIPIRE